MSIKKLSKSDYILGLQCPLALWFKYKRKDLKLPMTLEKQALFDTGNAVGELARKYFDKGYLVNAPCWDIDESVLQTEEAIEDGYDIIFEATAKAPNNSYSRIDILRKCSNQNSSKSSSEIEWDLIEVKGSTSMKEYHIDDIAFQYYVFKNAGYKIKNCYLMLIDNKYVKNGKINPKELFKLENITDKILKNYNNIESISSKLLTQLNKEFQIQQDIGCHCEKPFECDYKNECWKCIPKYSIFNIFQQKKAEKLYKTYGADLKNLPKEHYPTNKKIVDIKCFLNNESHKDRVEIDKFLNSLEYPLYFLDYETVMYAIPLFDGTKPYQQIPFQFSLHIKETPESELKHIEYLHKEQSDPRLAFTKALVESCGDKGSIIVYNQVFERGRNKELAETFIKYAEQLENINERVVDLLIPFRNRHLYSPKQKGSASIKYTLSAFTDMSYDGMNVANGNEAMNRYLKFIQGKLNEKETKELFEGLDKYCEQDTLAMVRLLEVLERESK